MQYFWGAVLCGVIAISLAGCKGKSEQVETYTEETYANKAYVKIERKPSSVKKATFSSDENMQKRRAQELTLGGKREDGLHRIDYSNPNYIDIVIFTKRAKDYIKRNGVRKALDDFMSPDSQFVAGRMYVFAYSTTGECLADWAEPKKIGSLDNYDFIDSARTAAELGGGWIEGVAIDPIDRKIKKKESYVVYAEDNGIIIGAGLYKNKL